jgi:general stress protein YciG
MDGMIMRFQWDIAYLHFPCIKAWALHRVRQGRKDKQASNDEGGTMPDAKKQRAGRKGGQTVSKDRAHMAAIGRKGGQRSRVKQAEKTEQKEHGVNSALATSEEPRPNASDASELSRETASGDQAVEMLKADHQRVHSLFEDYETAGGEDKISIAEKIMKELEIHTAIEEEIFYPAFREKADKHGRDLIAEALEEHQSVTTALKELKAMDPGDDSFDSTFLDMMHDVEHHVGEEEGNMLPLAEDVLGDALEELGIEMQRRKHDLMESFATEAMH